MQGHQLKRLSTNSLPATIHETKSLIPVLLNPEVNKDVIIQVNKNVNFSLILSPENTEISLLTAARIDEASVLKVIYFRAYDFIITNFPDTDVSAVAETVSRDLLEINPTWTILDVVYFFKWIRHNQGRKETKVLGNKINSLNILTMAAAYNEDRISEHESKLTEEQRRQTEILNNVGVVDSRPVKEIAEKLAEIKHFFETGEMSAEERRRQYRKLLRDKPKTDDINKNLFSFAAELAERGRISAEEDRKLKEKISEEVKQYHRDNEFCLKWLEDNDVSEIDGLLWFNMFRFRKHKKNIKL